MAINRGLSCPACGFAVKAGATACDFCGYEFTQDEMARMRRTQTRKGKNGSEKKGRGTRNSEAMSAADLKVEADSIERAPYEEDEDEVREAQEKIRDLERQLADAEKELDVISRMLEEEGNESESRLPVAGENSLPANTSVQFSHSIRTQNKITGIVPVPLPSPTSGVKFEVGFSYSGSRKLYFTLKGLSVASMISGLFLYAIALILSAQIGVVEGYFLASVGSILVALGIYDSLEEENVIKRSLL